MLPLRVEITTRLPVAAVAQQAPVLVALVAQGLSTPKAVLPVKAAVVVVLMMAAQGALVALAAKAAVVLAAVALALTLVALVVSVEPD